MACSSVVLVTCAFLGEGLVKGRIRHRNQRVLSSLAASIATPGINCFDFDRPAPQKSDFGTSFGGGCAKCSGLFCFFVRVTQKNFLLDRPPNNPSP